jgi:hypothetical protein
LEKHLYWLESEFENFVSSALQEVAAVPQRSTATSFDDWVYPQGVTSSLSAKDVQRWPSMPNKRPRYERDPSNQATGCEGVVKKRPNPNFQSFSFALPVGEVQIVVSRANCVSLNASDFSDVSEVEFRFLPQSNICPTLIHGRFTKGMNFAQEP